MQWGSGVADSHLMSKSWDLEDPLTLPVKTTQFHCNGDTNARSPKLTHAITHPLAPCWEVCSDVCACWSLYLKPLLRCVNWACMLKVCVGEYVFRCVRTLRGNWQRYMKVHLTHAFRCMWMLRCVFRSSLSDICIDECMLGVVCFGRECNPNHPDIETVLQIALTLNISHRNRGCWTHPTSCTCNGVFRVIQNFKYICPKSPWTGDCSPNPSEMGYSPQISHQIQNDIQISLKYRMFSLHVRLWSMQYQTLNKCNLQ